jgi:hypothetical protein
MPLEGTIRPVSTGPAVGAPGTSTQVVKFSDGGAAPPSIPTPEAAAAAAAEKAASEKAAAEAAASARPPEVESWRVAALAQKEKAARDAAASAKADRAAAESIRAQIEQEKQRFAQQQALYRQNPMALLQDHGFDYDSVTRYVAQGGWSPEQQQAAALAQQQAQIQALAQRQQEGLKQIEERLAKERSESEAAQAASQKQREEAAVADFKAEIGSFVKAEGEAYEMINLAGPNAIEQVYKTIRQHFEASGERLSYKAAADKVEEELFTEAQKIVEASKKLKSRFAPQPAPPPPARVPPSPGLGGARGVPPPAAAAPVAAPAERTGPETEVQRRQRVTREIEASWARARGQVR